MRRRGSGTIEGTRDKRFRVRFTVDGVRGSHGVFDTLVEAETALATLQKTKAARSSQDGITFGEWGQCVLDSRELAGIADSLGERNRWKTHVAGSDLAKLPIRKATSGDVVRWIKGVVAKNALGRGPTRRIARETVLCCLSLVSSIFRAALQEGIIQANPALGVAVPRGKAKTHDPWTYLTIDEQQALWSCETIPLPARTMLKFAVGTGLRQGEMFSLRLRDLDMAKRIITVRYGSKSRAPKGRKIRHVPLFGIGLQAAEEWLRILPTYAKENPHCLVFPTVTGEHRQRSKHLHHKRAGKVINPLPEYLGFAGIVAKHRHDGQPVRWQDLRHTFATSLLAGWWGRAWSLEEIKAPMGHSRIRTTERYAHFADSIWKRAAAETPGPLVSPQAAAPQSSDPREKTAQVGFPAWTVTLKRPSWQAPSNYAHLSADQAHQRAVEALRELAVGEITAAAVLLVDLIEAGMPGATSALEAVTTGSWARAIDLFAGLLMARKEAAQ